MGNIRLENNVLEVVGMLEDQVIAFLIEASGELVSEIARNSRVAEGQTKGSWEYHIDETNHTATIGSPLENAIWEEFGTGEYALKGDGRKGGWWIPVGVGENQIPLSMVEKYKWIAKRFDENGNITHVFTKGKEPQQMLTRAWAKNEPKFKRHLESKLRGN